MPEFKILPDVLQLDNTLSGDATRVYRIAQVEPSLKLKLTYERFREAVERLKQRDLPSDSD